MAHDVIGFEFDEQAWSRLQIAVQYVKTIPRTMQNQRLGIMPVCNLLLGSHRDNAVCSWKSDGWHLWGVPVDDRMLDSTL